MLHFSRHKSCPWRRLSMACGLALGSTVASAMATELTVQEAVRLALQNNTTLHAQQQMLTVAEGDLQQARTFPHNPHLELEGVAGYERTETRRQARTYGARLSQELPLGGKWQQRIHIAGASLERHRWDVHNAQRELLKEVKEAFYRLVFLEEKRAFSEQSLVLVQQLLRLAEERYRLGDSPQLDVNLARVEVYNVQRQGLAVGAQLTQARVTLNRLLGRSPETPVTVQGTLDAPLQALDDQQLRQQAMQQRPDLRSRTAALVVAQGEGALAQAERVPDVTVGVLFEREETGAEVRQTFGGSIAFPLPLWNRNAGAITAAQARTRMAELERATLQQAIATEVAHTVTELQQLQASLQLFQHTILPQSQDNLALLRQAFAAGEIGIVPLLTEQRAFLTINHEYLETRSAYRTALVALESILGGETP